MEIRTYILLALLLTQAGCLRNDDSAIVFDKVEAANVIGAYKGELPCVDCESINTTLHLERDKSYRLAYTYEGKSDDKFVKEGEWTIDKDNLILKGIDYQYKIASDGLVQLDLAGKEITGDLADKYLLSKVR